MSILSRIKEKKAAFSQQMNERSASRLQELRKRRERLEGKAKLSRAKETEKTRIRTARSARFKDQTAGARRTVGGLKKLKKAVDNRPSFGRGFGDTAGINPAFGLGKDKPKEKKKKDIVIRINQ